MSASDPEGVARRFRSVSSPVDLDSSPHGEMKAPTPERGSIEKACTIVSCPSFQLLPPHPFFPLMENVAHEKLVVLPYFHSIFRPTDDPRQFPPYFCDFIRRIYPPSMIRNETRVDEFNPFEISIKC